MTAIVTFKRDKKNNVSATMFYANGDTIEITFEKNEDIFATLSKKYGVTDWQQYEDNYNVIACIIN